MCGGDEEDYLPNIDVPTFDEVVDFATNMATFGTVGYENGQIKAGITTRAATDGLKEITGAKAQEEAIALQKQKIAEAKDEQTKNRRNQIERRRQQDLQQSRAASVISNNSSDFYIGAGSPDRGTDLLGV